MSIQERIWRAVRTAVSIRLPDEPPLCKLTKVRLRRGQLLKATGEFIVLCGEVVDIRIADNGREFIYGSLKQGDISTRCFGKRRGAVQTDIVMLSPGWDLAYPELAQYRAKALEAQAKDLGEMAMLLATHDVRDRVQAFVKKHPGVTSPAVVSKHVGSSREMCSRVLKELGLRKGRVEA